MWTADSAGEVFAVAILVRYHEIGDPLESAVFACGALSCAAQAGGVGRMGRMKVTGLAVLVALSLGASAAPQTSAAPARAARPTPSPSASPALPREAVIETEQGSLVVRLRGDLAPRHVAHFAKTARAGGYDGTTFHRIIPGGIIQGGDPYSKDPARVADYGKGGLGLLEAEFSDLPFARGVVAAARRPSSVDSGGSQFFIVLTDQPALKGQYTIFGEVVEGMDVADTIGRTPVQGDRPASRVEMRRVTVRDAGP